MADDTPAPEAPRRGVDPARMIEKLTDRVATLTRENAALECLAEDYEEQLAALRAELVTATSGRTGQARKTP